MPKLVEVAASYLHVRESPRGSNRGVLIDHWLTAIGSPLGSPWCAAFCHGVLRNASDPRKFVRSGRVQTMVDGGTLHDAKEAKPGDLVVFYFANLKRYAHIGIVEAKVKNTLITLEGNSIEDGAAGDSREGWGVWRKKRTISDRIKVLR